MKFIFTIIFSFFIFNHFPCYSESQSQELINLRKFIVDEIDFSNRRIEEYRQINNDYLEESYYWYLLGKQEATYLFSHWIDCVYFPLSDPPLYSWPER